MKFRNQMAEFSMLNRMFTTNKGFGSPGRQVLSSIVLDNVADVGFGCGHFVSVTTLGDTCKSKKKGTGNAFTSLPPTDDKRSDGRISYLLVVGSFLRRIHPGNKTHINQMWSPLGDRLVTSPHCNIVIFHGTEVKN